MTDFRAKLNQNINSVGLFTIREDQMINAHEHRIVPTLAGKNLNIKASQVPVVDIHRNYNKFRYAATGDLSTALSNGNTITVQLTRGQGSGHVLKSFLRFVLQNNTGAPIEMVNVAHLIDYIEWRDASGNNIATIRGDELFDDLVRMIGWDEWKRTSKLINCGLRYDKPNIIPTGATSTFYLPLVINWMASANFPIFMNDADMNVYVKFLSPSATIVSGAAPTLVQFSIDVEQEELPSSNLSAYIRYYKSIDNQWFYPYVRRQTSTMTLNPSTTYPIQLTGIRGDCVWLDFKIRASLNGHNARYNTPIQSFQLQDAEGRSITESNYVEHTFNQFQKCADYFPGELNLYQPIYTQVFSADDDAAMYLAHNAIKKGSHTFTGKENLSFITLPAGVNEIVNYNPTPAGVTSGNFSVTWNTPYGSETTPIMAYNTASANIINAVQSLRTFDGTFTISQPNVQGAFNITYTGNYGNKPITSAGYGLTFNPIGAATAGGAPAGWNSNVLTTGVVGMSAGSYIIDIVSYSTGIINLKKDGVIEVRNSN